MIVITEEILANIEIELKHNDLILDVKECEALDEYFMKCGYINPKYTIVHDLIKTLRAMNDELHREPSKQYR